MSNQRAQPQDTGQPVEHAEAVATVEQPSGGEAHAEPSFYGVTAPMFIAIAMLVVLGLLIVMRVPAAIARALDAKIATIRNQLSEAELLRKEAEALKAEYQAKTASADEEAAAMIKRAQSEAETIVAQAKIDAEVLIERRGKMAEDKIVAEEQAAIKQLRSAAADAAAKAAERLIADRHDAKSDEQLVNRSIADLGKL